MREVPPVRYLVRHDPPGKWMVCDAVLGSPVAAGIGEREMADHIRRQLFLLRRCGIGPQSEY